MDSINLINRCRLLFLFKREKAARDKVRKWIRTIAKREKYSIKFILKTLVRIKNSQRKILESGERAIRFIYIFTLTR